MPPVHLQPHHGADEACRLQVIVLVPLDALLVPAPGWVIHQVQLRHILGNKNANFKLFSQWFWLCFAVLDIVIRSESTSKWRFYSMAELPLTILKFYCNFSYETQPGYLNALDMGCRFHGGFIRGFVQQKLNDGIFVVQPATWEFQWLHWIAIMFCICNLFSLLRCPWKHSPPAQLTGHDGPTQLLLAQGTVEPPGHQFSNFVNLEGKKLSLL